MSSFTENEGLGQEFRFCHPVSDFMSLHGYRIRDLIEFAKSNLPKIPEMLVAYAMVGA
jgi:hypothetical protein